MMDSLVVIARTIVLQSFVAEETHCIVKLVIPWRVILYVTVKQHSDTYFLFETEFKISSRVSYRRNNV